jgi:D,D-heptose 1,7-bisphosphate phosphatase
MHEIPHLRYGIAPSNSAARPPRHGRTANSGKWPTFIRLQVQQESAAMTGSALFLDRDGVINVDRGYVHRLDQFEFVPGIFPLTRFWTNELHRPIVVVSNQSGIGRGYFDEKAHADLTRWMCNRFEAERAAIARVYRCPYHPLHGIGAYRREHPWRKPNPGMILQAIFDFRLDPARVRDRGRQDERRRSRRGGRAWFADPCRIPALPKRGAASPTP